MEDGEGHQQWESSVGGGRGLGVDARGGARESAQEGMRRHFEAVSAVKIPNIRGIKEEAGIQPTQATSFALRTPASFSIYRGDDTMVLQVLPQRDVGVESGASIIAFIQSPKGDNVKASQIYFQMAPFCASLGQNGRINPIPILRGAIEKVSGIKIGPPRGPQVAATAAEMAVTGAILDGPQRA